MKQLVLISIVLALLPLELQAKNANLSMRQDSLRASVLNKAHAASRWPAAQVDAAVNIGIVETCKFYPAYERIDTILIKPDSIMGDALNVDFDRFSWALLKQQDTMWVPVTIISPDTANIIFTSVSDWNDDPKKARKNIFVFHADGRLYTLPKLRTVDGIEDTLLISYFAIDSMLVDDADSLLIKKKYREKVIQYALFELFSSRYEFSRAGYWLNRFNNVLLPDDVGITRQNR